MHEVRPAGEVDRGLHEHLVHRDRGVAVAGDAALVAQRLGERLAQRDRDVLDGVVGVDVQVAVGLHGEVDAAVLGQRGEHVVVEPDAGGDVDRAGAVEVDLDDELGLAGGPLDACSAVHAAFSQSGAVFRRDLTQGGEEGVGLLRRAGGDPQPAGQADVADQHAAVEQRLPGGGRVGEAPEEHEVGVAGHAGQAQRRAARRRSGRAAALTASTVASSASVCASAVRAAAWVSELRW